MGNILDKVKDYVLGATVEDEYDEYEEYEFYDEDDYEDDSFSVYNAAKPKVKQSDDNIVSINNFPKSEIVLVRPKTIEEAGSICDNVRSNKSVVVVLEDTEFEVAQRIVDFISGVIYALDGDLQSVTNKVLIVSPKNVNITGSFKEELKSSGLLYSFAQSFGSKF